MAGVGIVCTVGGVPGGHAAGGCYWGMLWALLRLSFKLTLQQITMYVTDTYSAEPRTHILRRLDKEGSQPRWLCLPRAHLPRWPCCCAAPGSLSGARIFHSKAKKGASCSCSAQVGEVIETLQ